MKMFGTWNGYGKRLKKDAAYRHRYVIYGMVFEKRIPKLLTDAFIKEAGLNDGGTFAAARESLRTDYGLTIRVDGKEPTPKKESLPPSASTLVPNTRAKSEVKATRKTTKRT